MKKGQWEEVIEVRRLREGGLKLVLAGVCALGKPICVICEKIKPLKSCKV